MFLVVTADDFGVNRPRSEGILALASAGKLTHLSALVNGEVSKEMIGRFVQWSAGGSPRPRCSIGLHFNITEGFPISESARCSPLVCKETGRFRGKAEIFGLLSDDSEHSADAEALRVAITDEFEAQLNLFDIYCQAPFAPDNNNNSNTSSPAPAPSGQQIWVDGHHHVHLLSPVFEIVTGHPRVGGIRLPHQTGLEVTGSCPPTAKAGAHAFFRNTEDCFGEPFWRSVSSLALLRRGELGLQCAAPSGFFGLNIMGAACSLGAVNAFIAQHLAIRSNVAMESAPSGGGVSPYFVEVMTHVGHAVSMGCDARDIFFHDAFSCSPERDHELEVYSSLTLPSDSNSGEVVQLATADDVLKSWRHTSAALPTTDSHTAEVIPSACGVPCHGQSTLRLLEKGLASAEAAARGIVEHEESVAANAILSLEVGTYLQRVSAVHGEARRAALSAAEDVTRTFMRMHAADCDERSAQLSADMALLLNEVAGVFGAASHELLAADEGSEAIATLAEEQRESAAAAIRNASFSDP